LWAQHKYSVMARSPEEYRRIGRGVARLRGREAMRDLARELVLRLREAPPIGCAVTAIEHMWGYVRPMATAGELSDALRGPPPMLAQTQAIALRERQPYLIASTALSELSVVVAAITLS